MRKNKQTADRAENLSSLTSKELKNHCEAIDTITRAHAICVSSHSFKNLGEYARGSYLLDLL